MIEFQIANNDNMGNLISDVFMIHLILDDEIALQLESADIYNGGEKLPFENNRVFFENGCRVKYDSMRQWAGNMHWNAYRFQDAYALGFLYLLQKSGKWLVTEGYEELFQKWVKDEEITANDLGLPQHIQKLYLDPKLMNLFEEEK